MSVAGTSTDMDRGQGISVAERLAAAGQSSKTLVQNRDPRVPKACVQSEAANVSTHTPEPSIHFNFTCDDDEEYSIPLKDMLKISPYIALAPVSSIMEPEDSLIMGNEELSTIPEKESDEFIKYSVEDLIPSKIVPRDASEVIVRGFLTFRVMILSHFEEKI
ncbi:hypothetical protein Tco_1226074 [Tanacetum coccineum]